jgi:hypothetical protein
MNAGLLSPAFLTYIKSFIVWFHTGHITSLLLSTSPDFWFHCFIVIPDHVHIQCIRAVFGLFYIINICQNNKIEYEHWKRQSKGPLRHVLTFIIKSSQIHLKFTLHFGTPCIYLLDSMQPLSFLIRPIDRPCLLSTIWCSKKYLSRTTLENVNIGAA